MTSSDDAPNTGRDNAAAPGSSDRRGAARPVVPLPPAADDAPFGAGLVEDVSTPDSQDDAGEAVGDRLRQPEHDTDEWQAVPDEQMLDEMADDEPDTYSSELSESDAYPADDDAADADDVIDGGDVLADAAPRMRGGQDRRERAWQSGAPAALPEDQALDDGDDDAPAAPSEVPTDTSGARVVRDTWDPAATPRHLAVELKRIEARIHELLEGIDPRRKRRLEGTRRWLELQDDIAAMRFDGRIDEGRVREINALCAKRHRIFRHLNFLVATRPTWNT